MMASDRDNILLKHRFLVQTTRIAEDLYDEITGLDSQEQFSEVSSHIYPIYESVL
jgi:hypothetical protein